MLMLQEDAFIRAVNAARDGLLHEEGREVSVRELIRRAGFPESKRPGVAYHLNPQKHTGERPHRVPVEVIRRLAPVLHVTEEELAFAAAQALWLNVTDRDIYRPSEVAYVVSRFYGNEDVPDADRQAATARILQIIAQQSAQRAGNGELVSAGRSPITT